MPFKSLKDRQRSEEKIKADAVQPPQTLKRTAVKRPQGVIYPPASVAAFEVGPNEIPREDTSKNAAGEALKSDSAESSAGRAQDDDYKVGHGHPPREHQFKPGVSGHPGGKPKIERPSTRFAYLMEEEVETSQGMKKNGDLILARIRTDAIKGAPRATALSIQLWNDGATCVSADDTVGGDFEKLASLIPSVLLDAYLGQIQAPPTDKTVKETGNASSSSASKQRESGK